VIDDLFEGLLDALFSGKSTSKRAEVVMRMLFGLMGVALSVVGIYHMMGYDAGWHFRLAAAAMLFFLACFCAFNITLLLKWRWPGKFFILSLIGLFLVRILFGP
jgi:hypothetical protein